MFFLSVHVYTIHMFTAHLFTIHMFTTYMVTAHSFTTIFFLTRFPPQYRLDSIQVRWVTPTSTRRWSLELGPTPVGQHATTTGTGGPIVGQQRRLSVPRANHTAVLHPSTGARSNCHSLTGAVMASVCSGPTESRASFCTCY